MPNKAVKVCIHYSQFRNIVTTLLRSKGQINKIAHSYLQGLWLLPVCLQHICWDPHLGFSSISGRPIQICDRCEIHHCLKKLNGMLKCVNKISTYGWVGYNTRVHNVSLIVMYLNSHDLNKEILDKSLNRDLIK